MSNIRVYQLQSYNDRIITNNHGVTVDFILNVYKLFINIYKHFYDFICLNRCYIAYIYDICK